MCNFHVKRSIAHLTNFIMTQFELLAPAKDLECGLAAINCGADAVYIGAPNFGAREAASNSLTDIQQLVQYAHKYWAKVYVTLNTLLHDAEIPQAVQLVKQLYQLGVDALIIQDVGLLECDLPPLPLFASTQMHNHMAAKVAFLEQVGFQRAILARELSLAQIKEIRAKTSIELETFVHGALCVCYSGQCYLSYAIGGRSGNRGQCAQPCRRRYKLVDNVGQVISDQKGFRNSDMRHWLSLKDLNLSAHLADLVEAGVTSFKIEGRLKDKLYVMNIVSHYRQQLDIILNGQGLTKSSSGRSAIPFTPQPDKTFQRGTSTYFLYGRNQALASLDSPKAIGESCGRVVAVGQDWFTLESDKVFHNGDGLTFFNRRGQLQGTFVNKVEPGAGSKVKIFPDKLAGIEVGALIYRNHDHVFATQISKSQVERKIAVNLTLRESPTGLILLAQDEDGNETTESLICEKVMAEKADKASATMQKQLTKAGETEFTCENLTVDLAHIYFVPISSLNALRRNVLDKLMQVRLEQYPKINAKIIKNGAVYPEKELSYLGNVLNQQAAAFYRRHGVSRIAPAAESGLDMRGQKVMTTKYCLKYQIGLCPNQKPKIQNFIEPFYLVDEDGYRLKLQFNCRACEMEIYY